MRRVSAALVALCCAANLTHAVAASPPRPLDRLGQAQGDVGTLAGAVPSSSTARRRLNAAALGLANATLPAPWIDPGHVVAPAYGLSAFERSRTVLRDLERVSSPAVPAGRGAAPGDR